MTNLDIIKKFVLFGFNYPYDFISKCWSDTNQYFIEHIKYIFEEKSNRNLNLFFINLDKENQEKLINFIFDYYKK